MGYGFVSYATAEQATVAVNSNNGLAVGNKRLLCKLSKSRPQEEKETTPPSDNIYIKTLPPQMSTAELTRLCQPYGVIKDARAIIVANEAHKNTSRSKLSINDSTRPSSFMMWRGSRLPTSLPSSTNFLRSLLKVLPKLSGKS